MGNNINNIVLRHEYNSVKTSILKPLFSVIGFKIFSFKWILPAFLQATYLPMPVKNKRSITIK